MISSNASSKKIILGIIVLAFVVIAAMLYHFSLKESSKIVTQTNTDQLTAGTTPATSQNVSDHDGWKTSDKDGIVFQYPERLDTRYISANEWPPEVIVNAGEYSCVQSQNEEGGPDETVLQQVINGGTYCVKTTSEGAAGSEYRTYSYTDPQNDNLVISNFILRYTNCDVYNNDTDLEQEQYRECIKEESSFSVDSLVDQIGQTLRINE